MKHDCVTLLGLAIEEHEYSIVVSFRLYGTAKEE